MCVYPSCVFPCLSKSEHHSTYANMRRRSCQKGVDFSDFNELSDLNYLSKRNESRSSKVNWDIAEKMNIKNYFKFPKNMSIRKGTVKVVLDIDEKDILDLN